MYHDIGWKNVRSIIYYETFPASIPLDADGLSGFNFWYKIQNLSSYSQEISAPLSGYGLVLEFDPTNADLTINGPVFHAGGNWPYAVYGPNSHVLYLNNQLYGNSSVSMTIYEYSKVAIGYNNGAGSFGGGVNVLAGELWFREGGAINGGLISVGNPSKVAKVYIEDGNGGTTVPNNISVVANSTSTVGGLNASGTNTFSGVITLAANARFETWGGGTVDFTGDISGTYGATVSRVSGSGSATIRYTTNPKSYTGSTTIADGAVLELAVADALPSSNAITIQSGGTLVVSADQTLGNVTLNAGGTLVVTAGTTLTLGGTWTGGGTLTNNGKIVLTGPSAFPGASTTVTAMNVLTIKNPAGVTLDQALSVSGTLSLVSGILTTTSTRLLSVTNTATDGITGGSSSSYISGPVRWSLPASLGAGSTYEIPVGKGTYLPLSLIDPTTSGATTVTAEAFSGNAGGTPAAPLSMLSTTEYWSLASAGSLTDHRIALTRQSPVYPLNRMGRSATLNGTYASVGGTPSGNSIVNSYATGAGAQQYFVMARGGAGAVTLQPDLSGYCVGDTVRVPVTVTADSLSTTRLNFDYDKSVLLYANPGYENLYPGLVADYTYNLGPNTSGIIFYDWSLNGCNSYNNEVIGYLVFIYNGGNTTLHLRKAPDTPPPLLCNMKDCDDNDFSSVTYTDTQVSGAAIALPTISGPDPVCINSTGNVYTTETGMDDYLWDISPGGTITSGSGTGSVTVTWSTAGMQYLGVRHVLGADTSCRAVDSVTVEPPMLSVGPSSLAFDTTCVGSSQVDSVTLTGSCLNGGNLTVTCPAGFKACETVNGTFVSPLTLTSPGSNFTRRIFIQFAPASAQNYSGNVVIAGGGASSVNVAVSGTGITVPAIISAAVSPDSICQGGNATLLASVTGAWEYHWITPGRGTINTLIPSYSLPNIVPTDSGYYYLYASNGCGNSDTVQSNWLAVTPMDTLILTASPSGDLCVGETVTFTATSGFEEYYWTSTNGFSGGMTQAGPSNTWSGSFSVSGTATITVTGYPDINTNCSRTVILNIEVHPPPSTSPIYHP